jgi:ACS family hexuronate transporter-like MFS transporter
MDTFPETEPSVSVKSNARWVICSLLFFATTINYMDRQVLALLAPMLQREIGWSESQYAHIVIAFQAAYAIGLLGFGRLIDKVGTHRGYLISVLIWSAAAAGHALVRSVFGFGLARFALGLGEAGNFPAAVKAVAEWFPRRERALANGIFNSGSNVGAIVAPLCVPPIVERWGWHAAFIVLGAFGFLWVAAWMWFYMPTGLAQVRGDTTEPIIEPIGWGQLLRHRQMWAFLVGYAFTAPIWWFYLYWLPKFLNKRFDVDLLRIGLPLVVIYSVTSFGSIAGGWLSSKMIRLGWSVNISRKTAMLACAVCVMPVMFAAQTTSLWLAICLIALAAASHQGWAANLFALASDLFPKEAVASVVGIGGLGGALLAMAFSETAGVILEKTGSYWSLFVISSLAYIVALAVIHALVPRLNPVQL